MSLHVINQKHGRSISGSSEIPRQNGCSEKLIKLMNMCQADDVSISKAVKEFQKLFDPIAHVKEERRVFFENLVFMLQVCLVNGTYKERPNKFDEKIMDVVCRFCTAYASDDESAHSPWILVKMFYWLLDHHEASSTCARLRICMLINRLLKNLGDSFEIDEGLHQKIYTNMLDRLKDKVAEIRAQAVTALFRLQQPHDPACPVTSAFLFHLSNDPSALVRKTVLKYLGASKRVLADVLKRTMDVDEKVRLAAFQFLNNKIHIKSLRISLREEIFKRGLNDKSKTVATYTSKVLTQTWLNQFQGKVADFLFALDVGNSDGKTATEVLKAVFSDVPCNQLVESFDLLDQETKLVPFLNLTPEGVFYWKTLVSFLDHQAEEGNAEAENHLETLLPELTSFCRYTRQHFAQYEPASEDEVEGLVKEQRFLFIGKALLEMATFFDLSDEAGRQNLLKLCQKLLSSSKVGSDFVPHIMKVYARVQPKPERRIEDIAEIISDLRYPLNAASQKGLLPTQQEGEMENSVVSESKSEVDEVALLKVTLTDLQTKLVDAQSELDIAIKELDFVKAQQFKEVVDQLTKDQKRVHDDIQKAKSILVEEPTLAGDTSVQMAPTQMYRDDPVLVFKCLVIIAELLKPKELSRMTPTLQTLLYEFVIPCASSVNIGLRNAAVKAMGCICLRDIDVARKCVTLLVQMSRLDVSSVIISAMKVMSDLLMYFGPELFDTEHQKSNDDIFGDSSKDDCDNSKDGMDGFVAILCDQLEVDEDELQTTATEVLCKFLLCGLITSPKLISRFVIMWADLSFDRKSKLNHILGAFLQLYPSISSLNQQAVKDSFMMTLEVLSQAPPTSPLAEVSIEKIANFYADLTRPSYVQLKSNSDHFNVHDDFAVQLANEVLKSPDASETKFLIKLLLQLEVSADNFDLLRDLKNLTDQMNDIIAEKSSLKYLEKFGARLDHFLKNDPQLLKQKEVSHISRKVSDVIMGSTEEFAPSNFLTSTQNDDDVFEIDTTTSNESVIQKAPAISFSRVDGSPDAGLTVIPESDTDENGQSELLTTTTSRRTLRQRNESGNTSSNRSSVKKATKSSGSVPPRSSKSVSSTKKKKVSASSCETEIVADSDSDFEDRLTSRSLTRRTKLSELSTKKSQSPNPSPLKKRKLI